MAETISSAFRSFWYTMTTTDRHTDYQTAHPSGRHVPLSQVGLTSINTAVDSRLDVSSTYSADHDQLASLRSPSTPSLPTHYSPGMRSVSARANTQEPGGENNVPGGIPMQSFGNGDKSESHIKDEICKLWRGIDKWCRKNYPELFDELGEGCSTNDIHALEGILNCTLPDDVRYSLQVHDGQEFNQTLPGLLFGAKLLDCEEIVSEWKIWRSFSETELVNGSASSPTAPSRAHGSGSGSGSSGSAEASSSKGRRANRQSAFFSRDISSRQSSVPPEEIQLCTTHPSWIPLVKDPNNNYLAVDLAPGPKGRIGQIILCGREFDVKYVVAKSWVSFLQRFLHDLQDKARIDVETDIVEDRLKLIEFRRGRAEPDYFNILRWRLDVEHRRLPPPKRMSMMPPGASGSPTSPPSPYLTSVDPRAMGRMSPRAMASGSSSPIVSPKPTYGRASPLTQMLETHEGASASTGAADSASNAASSNTLSTIATNTPASNAPVSTTAAPMSYQSSMRPSYATSLVDVETPTGSDDGRSTPRALRDIDANSKGKQPLSMLNSKADGKRPISILEDGLKTIEI